MSPLRHRTPVIVASAAAAVIIIAVVISVFTVGPDIWAAATIRVAEDDESVTLTESESTVTVPVDRDWSYSTSPFDESRATLHSPDGVMTIEFDVGSSLEPDAAARALAGDVAVFDHESIGRAGVIHGRTADGEALAGALVDGGTVLAFVSRPSPDYDAELAGLLARIEVAP
ncbi:hypothetical protein [Microbacterium sp.]|uniref:hypothetical protein n=1 Tax=Microbacterium sp. TaxID=51671 RepID=UPI003C734DE8